MRKNELMNQETFNGVVVEGLKEVYGANHRIDVSRIIKNNDTVLYGLCISISGAPVAPTIYLNGYFDEYRRGKTLNGILEEVVDMYENSRMFDTNISISDITDFGKAKNHIVFKLVNRESNRMFLEDKPFIPFCDLAVIFSIIVSSDKNGIATITVKNNLLSDYWRMDVPLLYERALSYAQRLLPARAMDTIVLA